MPSFVLYPVDFALIFSLFSLSFVMQTIPLVWIMLLIPSLLLLLLLRLQERPPPVPASRAYTITGNSKKLGYPQSRIMKMNFPEDALANPASALQPAAASGELQQLKKGETVTVVGASSGRGHLIVEHKGQSYHVPFQYMELSSQTLAAIAGNHTSNISPTSATNGVKI